MISNRNTARIVGALFLTATVTWFIGYTLIESITSAPDYLIAVSENEHQVIIGVLFELFNSAAVVGIAVMMFPMLRTHNESIALGYVGFRIIEATVLVASAITALLLLTLSQEFVKAGAPDASYFQALGTSAIEGLPFSTSCLVQAQATTQPVLVQQTRLYLIWQIRK